MTHGVESSPVAGEDLDEPGRRPVGHWRRRFEPVTAPPAADAGALGGIRLAVKDMFAVAGERVGAGNPTVLAQAPVEERHSAPVQRLVDAGALIAGIARTDELAFSIAGVNAHEGAVVNPLDPERLVGGSTSGPTAAVLAGEADLGLGTDTAGSIRVPASYCGLWGLRMTHGAVDVRGMWPLAPSFDAVGLVGRDPRLLAAAVAALGAAPPPRALDRLTVPRTALDLVPAATRDAFLDGAERLSRRRGLALEIADGPAELEEWFRSFRAIQGHEAWQSNHHLLAVPGAVSEEVAGRLRAGVDVDATTHRAVLARAAALLCLPSASGPAPRLDVTPDEQDQLRSGTLRLGFLASLAGLPALSVPAAEVGGRPLGVALVGLPYDDLALLDLAG